MSLHIEYFVYNTVYFLSQEKCHTQNVDVSLICVWTELSIYVYVYVNTLTCWYIFIHKASNAGLYSSKSWTMNVFVVHTNSLRYSKLKTRTPWWTIWIQILCATSAWQSLLKPAGCTLCMMLRSPQAKCRSRR